MIAIAAAMLGTPASFPALPVSPAEAWLVHETHGGTVRIAPQSGVAFSLRTPCSQEMFEILYKHQDHHPSCFENLFKSFAPFGIRPEQISTTFNVFMKVDVSETGAVQVDVPQSRPGDYIELRAEMDMVCALTSCSAENSNNGTFKPIDYEIIARPG